MANPISNISFTAAATVSGAAMLLMSLTSLTPTASAQSLGSAAPEGLRCGGLIDLESSRPGPDYEFRGWDYRWETFNRDASVAEPMGVALDRNCNVYVANYSATGGSIVKLGPDGSTLAKFGGSGHGAGEFERLEGVAVDATGNMYAADAGNGRIQKLSPSGQVSQAWGSPFKCRDLPGIKCQSLSSDDSFHGTLAVGVDGNGKIFVVDGSHGVRAFVPDGPLAAKWGTFLGSQPGGFKDARGIGFDVAGNVYVADANNNRIQKFTPDGAAVAHWGSKDGALRFDKPKGVTVDGEGNVYVADTDAARIVMLSASGDYIQEWGRCYQGGSPCQRSGIGEGQGEFAQPHQMVVNARGELFVADRMNHRIQVRKAYPMWEQVLQPTPDEAPTAEEPIE
jgi:DNA-binding beta-propeller fold protein YncE